MTDFPEPTMIGPDPPDFPELTMICDRTFLAGNKKAAKKTKQTSLYLRMSELSFHGDLGEKAGIYAASMTLACL